MSTAGVYDWSALGLPGNPVPGDPDAVGASAAEFRSTGETLLSASDNLARLSAGSMRSDAVDALMAEGHKLAHELHQVSSRYFATASALGNYGPELTVAQNMAVQALQAAREARKRHAAAAHHGEQVMTQWKAATDEVHAADCESQWHATKAQMEAAASDLAGAKALVAQAIERRDAAAEAAISTIDAELKHSPVNDTVLDHLKQVLDKGVELLKKVGKFVWDHIDEIAIVLTVAGIVVAFIPGLDVLAPFLAAAGKAAMMVARLKAGIQFTQALGRAVKTGDFTNVIIQGVLLFGLKGGAKVMKKFVSPKIGGGAKSLVMKVIRGYNKALSKRTNDAVRSLGSRVLSNGVTMRDFARRLEENAPIPAYRTKAAQAIELLKSSGNAVAREKLAIEKSWLQLSKGGDLRVVHSELDHLLKLSRLPNVSNEMKRAVGETVGHDAQEVFDHGVDAARHWAEEKIKERSSQHRYECVGGTR